MFDVALNDCLVFTSGRMGVFVVEFRTYRKMIFKFLTCSYKQFFNSVLLGFEACDSI